MAIWYLTRILLKFKKIMLMRSTIRVLFLGFIMISVYSGCKKWEDAEKLLNQDVSKTLTETIAADPNLSTFSAYIKTTGVDTILNSSKSFTVWAPSNSALTGLDPAIVS